MRSRLVGERVDVLLQLGQGHPCVHRNAVAHDVEVAVREIDDAATVRILDVRVADVPFLRDGPVEDLRAARDLVELQGDPLADPTQGLADPVPGDAPADREQLLHEPEHLGPGLLGIEPQHQVAHGVQWVSTGSRASLPISTGFGMGTMKVPPASR